MMLKRLERANVKMMEIEKHKIISKRDISNYKSFGMFHAAKMYI